MFYQIGQKRLGPIDRYGKAHPFGSPAGGEYEGVDPDHLAVSIHQRTSGVSRINGGIRLEHFAVDLNLTPLPLYISIHRTDNAHGYAGIGIVQEVAKRIADGDSPFSNY